MTNENKPSIKPFCVDMMGEDLTDQQITEMFDLLIECGAEEYDTITEVLRDRTVYRFIGVTDYGGVIAHTESALSQDFNSNLIKYAELQQHLGLSSEKEENPYKEATESSTALISEELTQEERNCTTKRQNVLQVGLEDSVECGDSMFSKDVENKLKALNLNLFYSSYVFKGKKAFTISDEFDNEYYVNSLAEFNKLVEVLKVLDGFMKEEI